MFFYQMVISLYNPIQKEMDTWLLQTKFIDTVYIFLINPIIHIYPEMH